MPFDKHGRLHAGSIGLFDDDFEYQRPSQSSRRQVGAIRLEGSCDTEYAAQYNHRQPRSSSASWLKRVFCRGRTDGYEILSSKLIADEQFVMEKTMGQYAIVKKPRAVMITVDDIDTVDSPWLRECGMVKVPSGDPGGCHVVPQSLVARRLSTDFSLQ